MSAADELVHMVRQAAQQQAEDGLGPFAYGHIASYDPARHRVRVIFPGRRDENGLLVMSGWMPMSTAAVGAGWGLQYVPVGGATQQNPTAGEQVLVGILDRKRGTAAVLAVYYGADAAPSPGTSPGGQASPGDVILRSISGGFVYMHASGEIDVVAEAGAFLSLRNDGNCWMGLDLHVEGDVYDKHGSLDRLRGNYNTHSHPLAGISAPPSPTDPE